MPLTSSNIHYNMAKELANPKMAIEDNTAVVANSLKCDAEDVKLLSNKAMCKKELRTLSAGLKMMKKLAKGRLPNELIVHIFEATVLLRLPELRVLSASDMTKATSSLLRGLSSSDANTLRPSAATAICQTCCVQLNVLYRHPDLSSHPYPSEPSIAVFPTWYPTLALKLCHIRLYHNLRTESDGRLVHPAQLRNCMNGITSVVKKMPTLKTITFQLRNTLLDGPPKPVQFGFQDNRIDFTVDPYSTYLDRAGVEAGGQSAPGGGYMVYHQPTYRQVLLDLITRLKDNGPKYGTTFVLDVFDKDGVVWKGEEVEVKGTKAEMLAKIFEGLGTETSTSLRVKMAEKEVLEVVKD